MPHSPTRVRWRVGQQILVHFVSVTHTATVFVDDTPVAAHRGGHLPLAADITEHVTPGQSIRLTVVVDNSLSWKTIPPGVVDENEAGDQRLKYFHDFFNYSGIHRSVRLVAQPKTRIDDVSVVTDIDGTTGLVTYRVRSVGDSTATAIAVLRDASGSAVAEGGGTEGTLRVPQVHRWAIGRGYRYDLDVRLSVDGELVDS